MPSGQLGQMLRRLIGRPRPADQPDAQLLDQFVRCRDMESFEALVQRYGPMVLGVCRRILQDEHDAEDAFQATFLVFARRAAVVRRGEAVGSWLCGTAYRISQKARAATLRRRVQEKRAGTQLPPDADASAAWEEMRLVLDEELQQLPEKYRVPLVLCYLEGKSNEAAARQLGWAPGSMSYRLAQARERLRERLMHRGVGIAPALLAPLMTNHALEAVPAALGTVTAKIAPLFAAGDVLIGLVSPQVLALAEGMVRAAEFIRTMLTTLFAVLVLLTVGVGSLFFLSRFVDDNPVADNEPGAPIDVKPLDDVDRICLAFSNETQRFGIACTQMTDPRDPRKPKLLTSDDHGLNNNTRVKIDDRDYRFGFEAPGVRWFKDKDGKVWKGVKDGERRWVSIMEWKEHNVRVKQTVQVVVGEQTHLYDTALVKYAVQNLDSKSHSVGVRLMLDTYIGANDGVPILIPPSEGAPSGRLLDTLAVFENDKVPPFLRALESPDPNDRNGTVAEMGLRLRGLQPLSRVVICRWPRGQGEGQAAWDWNFEPMNVEGQVPDSCVVLYWDNMKIPANDRQTMGFTYGLGRIADGIDKVPMRLLAGGSTKIGGTFTLTVYVKGFDGEKVKLLLPEGLALAAGQKAEQVIEKAKGAALAQLSWQVTAAKVGKYTVTAAVNGRETKLDVHVREHSIFD